MIKNWIELKFEKDESENKTLSCWQKINSLKLNT